jgi:predicted lipoprotein with Yx(FWY)xxD motif
MALAATALVAVAIGAAPAAAGYGSGSGSGYRSTSAARPVSIDVVSPRAGYTAGRDGAGFVVDLSLTARNASGNQFLSPEAGYTPVFNNPTAPSFAPGPDAGAPGLVVMLSTTPNTPGTRFQGPRTNLAGLFQINGVGTTKGGRTQTHHTWQIGKAGFGSGPSTLTAYVVKGTSPEVVPTTGLEQISNTVQVRFTITAPPTATPATAATPSAATTLKATTNADLGDILVDTDGRTLYLFEKDRGTTTACRGACLEAWPPLRADGAPTVAAGLDASKVGTARGQVTYAGHLLYYYAGDSQPGDTTGARIPKWAAVSPTGAAIHAD